MQMPIAGSHSLALAPILGREVVQNLLHDALNLQRMHVVMLQCAPLSPCCWRSEASHVPPLCSRICADTQQYSPISLC